MAEEPVFVPQSGEDFTALRARLASYFDCRNHDTESFQRHYFDSFDWRLLDAGKVLEGDHRHGGIQLRLRPLRQPAHTTAEVQLAEVPRFPGNLPAGELREGLDPVVGIRALLPRLSVLVKRHSLSLLDADRIIARLDWDETTLAEAPERILSQQVRLHWQPGETAAQERLAGLLTAHSVPQEDDPLTVELQASGIHPEHYATKPTLVLDPAMRADRATRIVLQELFATMLANEDGMRNNLDSEFLHDYRVSLRRTRSALSQIKKVFTKRQMERFKNGFRWLGRVTSPTRDLDVYLLAFEQLQEKLPAPMAADLAPLAEVLQTHQTRSHSDLVRNLDSPRYQQLLDAWQRFLQAPEPAHTSLDNATLPVYTVARKRIWKMYRRVVKEGRALHSDSPSEDFHELRKNCKKLRYLMEFFHSLFPEKVINQLIKALKALQSDLGDFQDLAVQIPYLSHLARELRPQPAQLPTILAMGGLQHVLYREQTTIRERFERSFADFTQPELKRCFKKLFKPPKHER